MIHKTTRSILSVLLAVLLLVASTPLTPAFAEEGGTVSLQSESGESEGLKGDGTANEPYQIATAEQLAAFRDKVNRGETNACAVLTADIDLSGVGNWIPIGSNNLYSGTFDGDGHTISGLNITGSENDQGLFRYVSGSGKIENLSVSGSVSVSGSDHVGGVVGLNLGTVINCAFSGSVSGSGFVGGVVGLNNGTVTNCTNTGKVSGSVGSSVGGIVGQNNSGGTVTNCYNTGAVSVNGDVGGVVGNNSGTVTNCYNTGSVTGSGNLSNVGGVVGKNGDTVTNCYNTGKVTVTGGSGSYVGGVVGANGSGTVTGCYFLQTDDVNSTLKGIGSGTGGSATELTADQFKNQNSFTNWMDFDTTWSISGILGRPVLKSNPQGGLGTDKSPYQISTADELKNFAIAVNDGDYDACAVLMENIDLKDVCGKDAGESGKEVSWTPIGNSKSNRYTGTFNGNGHKIENLYINNTDRNAYYQGLFGYVGSSGGKKGTVQNLSVSGSVNVTGNGSYVGGVVGWNSGNVTNCYNTGGVKVTGNGGRVGGVVGYNNGNVKNCYNTGSVSGPDSGSGNSVGGVVGDNNGNVTGCYNTGSVSGPDSVSGNSVGGVVGWNISSASASVTNCYFLKTADVNENLSGIGNDKPDATGKAEAKSLEQFQSGEVAYLLQKEQKAPAEGEEPPLVWGQSKLGETTSLPTLNPTAEQKVYQVTFDYGDSFAETDDRYDYHYGNANDNVTLPTSTDQIPEYEGHTLTGWLDANNQQVSGTTVTVTADTKFTALWQKDTVNYTITVSASPTAGGTVSGSGEYSEGTQVTVTATPATGYHFVKWTENGTQVSTSDTYSFTATANRTLTANFAADAVDPDPTPTPTPDPTPSGPSTGDSTGWADIRDELENTAKGDQITIDMGDETKVPAEIFESLAGKDVDVTFDLGDVQWTVNGADIPTDTDFTDLDLGVNLDTSGIPVNVINAITGEVGTVQITLAHNGEFGFTLTLTAPLGKENAGYWANLYHFDESAEALNFEAAAKIDETGSVTIPFSHASQYAIVIDDHSHARVAVSDIFTDVAPNAWYTAAIQYAYDNGLMTGVSDTEFAPEATTTRAMIVSILARLENVTTAEAAGFADVSDEWYATAVNWAASENIVAGFEDGTFRPNDPITREQLAAILMNYAAYKGEDVSARADLDHYTDQPSAWAEETMSWAVAEGLISGVTADTLQPQGAATRAQVAAILQRFLSE